MSIPFLPGYTIHNPSQQNFKKSHGFIYKNGYSISRETAPGIGGSKLLTTDVNLMATAAKDAEIVGGDPFLRTEYDANLTFGGRTHAAKAAASKTSTFVPAHVAYDGLVCLFDGYFKETVRESALENYRVRKCKFVFYVEDESISIHERKVTNSGMPQGNFLKRQRCPRANGQGYIGIEDLLPGKEVDIYGRVFRMTDADEFARQYCADAGLTVGPAEPTPEDPYSMKRKDIENTIRVSYSDGAREKLYKFLKNDRKVLRFFCTWDDRESMFGEIHPLVLNYFLVDDTVQVLEVAQPNSGRDPFPVFLNRQRLQRNGQVGSEDPLDERDLAVGQSVAVLGRSLFIYDCDDFTRDYYERSYNQTFGTIPLQREEPVMPPRVIPPHNGIGSEEDSLGSCMQLVPKPPKRDFRKILDNEGKVLRFAARMVTTRPEDIDRRFIIAFYLADDGVAVFEPPRRNSGIIGGKFLEKGKRKNPATGAYYCMADFVVDSEIVINGFKFILTEMDEFARKYIERQYGVVAEDEMDAVYHRLRKKIYEGNYKIKDAFRILDVDHSGFITIDEFEVLMKKYGFDLNPEELLYLMRRFDSNRDGRVDYTEFCEHVLPSDYEFGGVGDENYEVDVQAEDPEMQKRNLADHVVKKLRDLLFGSRKMLRGDFEKADDGSGWITKEAFLSILSGYRVQLTNPEANAVFETFGDNSGIQFQTLLDAVWAGDC